MQTSILWSPYPRLIKLWQIQFHVRILKNMAILMVDRYVLQSCDVWNNLFIHLWYNTSYNVNIASIKATIPCLDVGVPNGNCAASVSAEFWWCIWWNIVALDCRSMYSFAPGDRCCISIKISQIYRKLCHAPDTVSLLLLYEAFLGPEVTINNTQDMGA